MNYYFVYDIETYPNCFTIAVQDFQTGENYVYEMSWRRDDTAAFLGFIESIRGRPQVYMVGFNNDGFDYPIIHDFIQGKGTSGCIEAYEKCQQIINSNGPFGHSIWPDQQIVRQIDLYKIHHFDNNARRTSLKQVEFNMRVPNLMDLPFPPGTMLDGDQIDALIRYNVVGDVENTAKFLRETLPAIEFRQTYSDDWINFNDTKIGKQYFIGQLDLAGIQCFGGDNKPLQTLRPSIELRRAVLDDVWFQHPEFQRIHEWFLNQEITETKGVFTDVNCTINGFKYVFGLGGIHGSVESQTVRSDDEYMIEDWDVASYYPNLAIANGLYPEHLGPQFCKVYQDVYNQRRAHAKGTPQNAAMKLALNGVYGDSNNKYSPFYDSLYTMSITINGQLLLCMLADQLMVVPGLTMIQINTDGLSIRYPRAAKDSVHAIMNWWEGYTKLELESAEYDRMHIRDVNNYVAVGTDGKVKRKGAYEYEREHHQNHSALVIPKAAEMVLLYHMSVEEAVHHHTDVFDYALFVKAPSLEIDGVQVQGRSRYYVSTTGGTLKSIKPPPKGMVAGDFKKAQGVTNEQYWQANVSGFHDPSIHTKNRSVYGSLISEVEKGWPVTMCNDIMTCTNPINYEYYYDRVRKLTDPLQ